MWEFPLFPDQAASGAQTVDTLFFLLLAISLFFAVLIAGLLIFFAVRYRRTAVVNREMAQEGFLKLEIGWTIIPLLISMGIFAYASKAFFDSRTPPEGAMEIYVVGHQWMWKMQHPEGNREINELHIPIGRPIKLTMATQDVIHSFYIPAFRVKQDIIPGKYGTEWFEATKPGKYHLFCAEYCGTLHSGMIGTVYAMEPAEYSKWLSGVSTGTTMASAGEQLFTQYGCANCHFNGEGVDAPSLRGVYGTRVKLQSGDVAMIDANYIRESILQPQKKIVPGFSRLMPVFDGQINEDQIGSLVEYIKSLTPADSIAANAAAPSGSASEKSSTPTRSNK